MDQKDANPCKKYFIRMESIAEILDDVNRNIDNTSCYYILLDHIATQLEVNAVALNLRLNGTALENIARLGFRSPAAVKSLVHKRQSLACDVLDSRKGVRFTQSSNNAPEEFIQFLTSEGFYDYLGLPVTEKDKLIGVLELFSFTPINITADWQLHLRFILALCANTINRKHLMIRRKSSETELEVAYTETLEAWVRALEIRDQYTAGHTQRVLEITLRLATKLGISDELLVHVSRGVLLHDIGKLAISDIILRKTGPLDNKEWQAMREHPRFAYNLLKPIQYLKPALDIPYCHHEKWDGSGYPQGLKGEEIPYPARIFSVVDVWDALTTDRPYRKAWAREDALTYINSKAGSEFDPKVVEEFVELIATDEISTKPVFIAQ